jgi:translocation and assembly module TamA
VARPLAILLILLLLLPGFARAELGITGLDRDLERNVRAYTTLDDETCDAEAWRVRRRFRSLEADIRKALQPFGFYAPRIATSLEFAEDCWRATADVIPGDPVTLRDIDIDLRGEAADDPDFAGLTPTGLAPGARLRHADYDRYKQSLQVLAADRGYLDATFSASRLDIYPEERVADVTLHFDSGPRYRIGEIRQEQAFLDPKLVTGYLDLDQGSFFDGRELARAYRDLSNSGYFGRIEIVPLHDAATDRLVPIRVALEPGTRIEYTLGIGASTDTGPRLRAGFRNNRLNERGHRLVTDLNVSTRIQGISAEYRKPLKDPRSDWMSYTGAVTREDNDTFINEGVRAGLRRSKRLNASWIRTLSLDVSYERYTVGLESDNTTLVLPGIAFDHKYADRDLYPNRGRRLGVELLGTSTKIGSNTSFAQAKASARWVRALGAESRILARARIGATQTSDFEQLPPSARFFAGGDESVRGFDYDSLGPTDAEGNVIGGRNLLTASIEFERRLFGNYYGAVFADAGNAFNGTDLDAAVGAGLGIKWRSPLGPIRLYVGFPVTDEASGARVHLRLGADL